MIARRKVNAAIAMGRDSLIIRRLARKASRKPTASITSLGSLPQS
jgi:hypothetical protein